MKQLVFSKNFQKKLQIIKLHDAKLFKKIQKQLELFIQNPRHHSLRIHKLEGKLKNTWSLSISMGLRLLYIEDSEYYFFDIGTHDQIYRK